MEINRQIAGAIGVKLCTKITVFSNTKIRNATCGRIRVVDMHEHPRVCLCDTSFFNRPHTCAEDLIDLANITIQYKHATNRNMSRGQEVLERC